MKKGVRDNFTVPGMPKVFVLNHGYSVDGFLDLPRQFGQDLTCKEHNECDILPVGPGDSTLIKKNYKIDMSGLPFRCKIQITQNTIWASKRKSQAFKSGSNQMADA